MPTSLPNADAIERAYTDVVYPGQSYPQSHPDRLATVATLYGLTPPPLGRCRVLELGCGDGSNLMPVALALPESTCVGIDLAGESIARGQRLAAEAGLANLTLRRTDVTEVTPDFGEFDYILAHGLYSWVPPAVQERVMEVCKRNLAPGGVAYLSYNADPGCRLRRISRDMMLYHVAGFGDPAEKVRQGRALMKFLAEAREENDPYGRLLRWELEHVGTAEPGSVYHDDVAPDNHPVYFRKFAARAARQGLQFLSEAYFQDSVYESLDPAATLGGARGRFVDALAALTAGLPPGDVVAQEQYADFLRGRKFRHTLLCHADAAVRRPPGPERAESLYASAWVKAESAEPDLRSAAPERFTSTKGASIITRRPVAKAALVELTRRRPRPVHFEELLSASLDRLGPGAAATAGNDVDARTGLGMLLLTGYASNVLSLRAHAPQFVAEVSDRPTASPLARAQAKRGPMVTDLLGTHVKLTAPLAQRLVVLCDGSRDRAALVRDLAASVAEGKASIEREGRRVTDPKEVEELLRGAVDARLEELARLALLVA